MPSYARFALSACLFSLFATVVSTSAHAAETDASSTEETSSARPSQRAPVVKIHLTPPLGQWMIVNPFGSPKNNGEGGEGGGAISIVGGSLSVELREFWAMEAGGTWLITSIEGDGYDVFARGGIAPIIHDSRGARGRGWTTQFDALLGYRAIKRYDAPDGHPGTEFTHGVRADAGFEFIGHLGAKGFGVRLLTGFTLPIHQTRTGDWADHGYIHPAQDMSLAWDIGLDLSLTLGGRSD